MTVATQSWSRMFAPRNLLSRVLPTEISCYRIERLGRAHVPSAERACYFVCSESGPDGQSDAHTPGLLIVFALTADGQFGAHAAMCLELVNIVPGCLNAKSSEERVVLRERKIVVFRSLKNARSRSRPPAAVLRQDDRGKKLQLLRILLSRHSRHGGRDR